MKPGILDFTIYQGTTFELKLRWSAKADYVDLTGCIIRMQVREKHKSPFVILDLSTTEGSIEILDPIRGEFVVRILDTVTSTLTFKTAVYDIEVVFPDQVIRMLEGTVTLSEEVTR